MRSEDITDEQLYAIVPPNGGWGWLVVICAFYCNIVADGIQLTFGVFLKSISSDLKADYSQVSLAASLMFGIHLLMGPVCCGFNNAFGLRPVTIMGSLICGFGIGISYFSTSYLYLCFTFGVIGGIGLGLVYMNTLVITSLYFTSLLPAAIAVVVSGTGVGTMIFAWGGSFLLRWTTWQNSFLLQSVMAVSMAFAAISFRPLQPLRVKLTRDTRKSLRASRMRHLSHGEDRHKKKGLLLKTELPKNESFLSLQSLQTVARGFVERVVSSEFVHSQRKERCQKCSCRCRRRRRQEEDILFLKEVKPDPDNLQDVEYVEKDESPREEDSGMLRAHSGLSFKTVFTRIDIPEENFKQKMWNRVKRPIIKMFDFRLLKSFYFTLFATIGATQLSSFLIVLIYIKDRSETLGFSEETSAYFIVAIGASNVFWRLLLGGLSIIPKVHKRALSVSTTVIGGIATIVSGFEANIIYQVGFCVLFSLSMGSFAVFRMPFLVDFVGVEKIENATGICLLFMGVACIAAPPFFGWLLRVTHSFDPMFITSGSVIVVSGVLQIAVRKIKTSRDSQQVTDRSQQVTDRSQQVTDRPQQVTDRPQQVTDR